jgi:hypothetical protein
MVEQAEVRIQSLVIGVAATGVLVLGAAGAATGGSVSTAGRFAISPTWSPDGNQVMFALDPIADEDQHPPNGLYVVDKNGKGLELVIGGEDFKREPDWVR